MWLRRLCAAIVVTAAALASGCGDDVTARNAYVSDVQRAQSAFVTRFDQTLARLTATSTVAQDRATLATFTQIAGDFRSTLARVEPPSGVRAQHRALVAAVARFRGRLDRARAGLRRGSGADRSAVRTQLSSSVGDTQAEVSKAIERINVALRG